MKKILPLIKTWQPSSWKSLPIKQSPDWPSNELVEAVKKDSSILLKDPLLYMYYYANKDRYSAFFLIEYFNRKYLFDLF